MTRQLLRSERYGKSPSTVDNVVQLPELCFVGYGCRWAGFGTGVGGGGLSLLCLTLLLLRRHSMVRSFSEMLDSPQVSSIIEPLITSEDSDDDCLDSDDEDETLKSSTKRKRAKVKKGTMKKLLMLSAPDFPILFGAFVCLIISSTCQAAIPHYGGQLIDDVALGDMNRYVLNK